jgi:hypothetical protein
MKKIYSSEYFFIYVFLACLLLLPLILAIIFTIFLLPWGNIYSSNICNSAECVEKFSKSYFGAFSWYASWLSVSYNITTILGVAIAVLTYYKNQQSQAISSHFSNVDLFKNYVSEEISKSDWLSIASFDLMKWYLSIYPESKAGNMQCSEEYTKNINELEKCITDSNIGIYDKKKIGYQFSKHQQNIKKIFRSLGIRVKETNRLSFYEIEGEILNLIEKVNSTFPSSEGFNKFSVRSYK